MEAIQAKQKRAGHSMYDDPNMRAARPDGLSSASQRKQLNGAYVPSRTHFIGAKPKSATPVNPDSDDEIDSLHGSAADSDDEERTRITRVPSKKAKEEVYLDVNGEKMAAHPNFLPAKKPLPKFKKNSQTVPSGSSTSTDVSPASSQPLAQPTASGSGTSVNLAALRNNENGNLPKIASSSRTPSYSSLNRAPSSASNTVATRTATHKPLLNSYPRPSPLQRSRSSSLEVLPPEPVKKGKSNAKPKPAPFPLNDSPSASPVASTRSSRRAQSPPQTRPLAPKPSRTSKPARKVNKRRIDSESESASNDDLYGSGGEENTPRGKATRPPDKRTSPIASRSIPDIDLTELERKPAARPKPRPKVKRKSATDFPLPSPLSSQGGADRASSPEPVSTPKKMKMKKNAFPSMSPLSSPAREKTAPFPMSMSPLKLSPVRDTPNAPIWEESEHEYEHIDVTYDADNLCPYCDALMPSIGERTPQLTRLLAAAERRSKPAPRPGHPHARRAPVSVHGAVCERHDFETKELPRARARGWPTNIAWDALRGRIERLQPKLAKLVQGDEKTRSESVFWRSVEEDVRKSGSRAVAGVKGQFESFDKVQPGYYGEKGSHIIYQTIYNLFPPSSFDAQSLSALSPDIVLQRVLVPEAALALVMEDMEVDVSTASRVLVESARFGAMMYPLHDGDQDHRDIGQGMVRERARARAKVIAAEERVEEEMLREEKEKRRKREELSGTGSEEGERRTRTSKRRKPTPDASVPSDADDPPAAKTPKPRTRAASRYVESDSDASLRSARSTRSTRSRSGAAPKASSGADSDTIEVVDAAVQARPKPRRVTKRAGAASSDMDVSSGAEPANDVEATPRPLNRQRQAKGKGKTAGSSRDTGWSHSQLEPLDITSSSDEDSAPQGTNRRSRSKPFGTDKAAVDSASWLLSE